MRHLYVINREGYGSQYGIGTYIKQIMLYCQKYSLFNCLTMVTLGEYVKDFEIQYQNDIRYLKFPFVDWEKNEARCYRNIAYLIALHVNPKENNIFHFNYLQDNILLYELKKICGKSVFVLTLHYFRWSFTLRGNYSYFNSIISEDCKKRNKLETSIFKEFEDDRSFFGAVNKVICLSSFTKRILKKNYLVDANRIVFLPNVLEDEAVQLSKEKRKTLKKELGFEGDNQIILYVGRLESTKGLEYLIRAFRIVLKTFPQLHLVIVGDGDYNRYLRECIGIWRKIIFTGRLSKKQLYELYQITDMGVLPSFHEQCSYVGIEMLMHGIPLITTDALGIMEMTKDVAIQVPIYINHFDEDVFVSNWVTKLLSFLHLTPEEKLCMRMKSRIRYEQKYSFSNFENRVKSLWTF